MTQETQEIFEVKAYTEPFPHMIINNLYNKKELELIWEELNFFTKPGKLLEPKHYGGVVDRTNACAVILDEVFANYRQMSNILTVCRKLFDSTILQKFGEVHDCCYIAQHCNYDITKLRYYHNNDYYEPHMDRSFQFLGFSYFYKEPKKFEGGKLLFPKYDYTVPCDNNSIIIMPGWVEHAVSKVSIEDSEYFDGWGRYAITHFFGNKSKGKLPAINLKKETKK
jgi:Rps23 Pro-64 3,4-dihydroxylase Tpa1-like proline 4-hydroxylase